jgi:hypothetical protein
LFFWNYFFPFLFVLSSFSIFLLHFLPFPTSSLGMYCPYSSLKTLEHFHISFFFFFSPFSRSFCSFYVTRVWHSTWCDCICEWGKKGGGRGD